MGLNKLYFVDLLNQLAGDLFFFAVIFFFFLNKQAKNRSLSSWDASAGG